MFKAIKSISLIAALGFVLAACTADEPTTQLVLNRASKAVPGIRIASLKYDEPYATPGFIATHKIVVQVNSRSYINSLSAIDRYRAIDALTREMIGVTISTCVLDGKRVDDVKNQERRQTFEQLTMLLRCAS